MEFGIFAQLFVPRFERDIGFKARFVAFRDTQEPLQFLNAKVVSQYGTLGQYDFITVVEAPDDKTIAKVSVELGSRGTMTSQTLAAMPAEDLASSL